MKMQRASLAIQMCRILIAQEMVVEELSRLPSHYFPHLIDLPSRDNNSNTPCWLPTSELFPITSTEPTQFSFLNHFHPQTDRSFSNKFFISRHRSIMDEELFAFEEDEDYQTSNDESGDEIGRQQWEGCNTMQANQDEPAPGDIPADQFLK
ncbi:hypothetical protein EYC84_006462 [Monilinia fructicola]|uniref:Uncharacterized protein n=1 Tax=Monilinia fructicola TaxID=38448 RepID=A0A5M9K3F5_MONFR|nr:hypothetical protein EYC84_006462 [Monilinia fructicola]